MARRRVRRYLLLVCLICALLLLLQTRVISARGFAAPPPIPPADDIAQAPVLGIALDDGVAANDSVPAGGAITYTLVYSNLSASRVTNLRVSAIVPQYTTLAATNPSDWACEPTGPGGARTRCVMARATFPGHGLSSIDLIVAVDEELPLDLEWVTLSASVTAREVVGGEPGTASLDTPIDANQGEGDAARIYLPVLAANISTSDFTPKLNHLPNPVP